MKLFHHWAWASSTDSRSLPIALASPSMAPVMLSGSMGPGSRDAMRVMKSSTSFWLFMPTVSMLRANSWVLSPDSVLVGEVWP